MKASIRICCIGIWMISQQISPSYGQDPNPQGTIQDVEFIIKKEMQNELSTSTRLFKRAPLPLPTDQQPRFQIKYALNDFFMGFQPIEHKIKLWRAQQDRLERLYSNYCRLGHGNIHSPYILALLSNTRHPKYAYGIRLGHISEGKKAYVEEYYHTAALHGKMLTKRLVLDGSINYLWDKHPCREDIKDPKNTSNDPSKYLIYHQIWLSTRLYNYLPDTLNYQTQVHVSHLHQKKVYENQFKANLHADYQLNTTLQLHTDATWQLMKYTNPPTVSMTRHVISLQPILITALHDFTIHAGAHTSYQNDQKALPNHVYLHPCFKVTYAPNQALRPYIALDGSIEPHSWQSHVAQNPWLAPSADIRYTNKRFMLSIGIKSDMIKTLTCHAGLSISKYQNYPCFTNNLVEPRHFDIQYDSSATVIPVFTELTKTSFGANLVTRLQATYFHYHLTDLPHPWHKPQFRVELCNSYNFHDTILVKNNLFWDGRIWAQEPYTKASQLLADVIDLGLSIEYFWNKRFSIFLDCQNLLALDNNRYLYTPTKGIHLMLGMAYGW